MKKSLLTILATGASLSLSAQSAFIINGTAENNLEGKIIYLYDAESRIPSDSTVVKEGKYNFKAMRKNQFSPPSVILKAEE